MLENLLAPVRSMNRDFISSVEEREEKRNERGSCYFSMAFRFQELLRRKCSGIFNKYRECTYMSELIVVIGARRCCRESLSHGGPC